MAWRKGWLFAFGVVGVVGGLCLAGRPALGEAEPVRPAEFGRLGDLIRPSADEDRWDRIPWLSSLWQARQQAASQGKPILLWEMDGHPLGCT